MLCILNCICIKAIDVPKLISRIRNIILLKFSSTLGILLKSSSLFIMFIYPDNFPEDTLEDIEDIDEKLYTEWILSSEISGVDSLLSIAIV